MPIPSHTVLLSGGTTAAAGLTNVVAWWDASAGSTTTSFVEDLVGGADLGGSSLTTDTQNGLTVLKTTGGGQLITGSTSPLAGTSQPFGVLVVAKNLGALNLFQHGSGAGARPHAVIASGVLTMNAGSNANDGASDLFWHVYYLEFNGSSSKVYIDGELESTINPGTGAPVSNVLAFLDNIGGGSASTTGTLWAEAKITTGTQSSGDVLAEAVALINKWGLRGTYGTAIGGTITVDTATLVEHTFLTSGKLRVPKGGTQPISYLVVAGGGSGAVGLGGGGGAGGYLASTANLTASQAITIGAGGPATGSGALADGTVGSDTVFGSIATASGGGKGGHGSTGTTNGGNGGSGGGGGANNVGSGGSGGTGSQGSNGGTGESSGSGPPWAAGGGGGASAVGGNGSGSTGGAGGAGTAWNGTTYAGGGGGGATSGGTGGTGGAGGSGGGGAGSGGSGGGTPGTAGTANTGGGGGGSGDITSGSGAGGSGIVKVRYDPTAWTP